MNEYFMIVLFYDILLYISSSHSLLPLKYVDVPFTSCNLFVFPLKVSCRWLRPICFGKEIYSDERVFICLLLRAQCKRRHCEVQVKECENWRTARCLSLLFVFSDAYVLLCIAVHWHCHRSVSRRDGRRSSEMFGHWFHQTCGTDQWTFPGGFCDEIRGSQATGPWHRFDAVASQLGFIGPCRQIHHGKTL